MKISDLKSYSVVAPANDTHLQQKVTGQVPEATQGVTSRVSDVINNAGQNINQAITGQGQYAGESALRRGTEAVATAFNAVPQTALAVAPDVVRKPIEAVGHGIAQGFQALTDLIGSNKQLQDWTQAHPEATKALMDVAGTLSAGGQIAGNILGAESTANTITKGAGITKNVTSNLVNNAKSVIKSDNAQNLISPKKDVVGATGEILQGKPTDIAKGTRALNAIDTTGVKTYADLGTKINDSIKTLSQTVDSELAKDTTKTKLSDLNTKLKTKSGNIVQTNYVNTALEHLRELYQKTGDIKSAADIDELIKTANSDGLTKLDVNNIARVYGVEFGDKAFSKTGDPLTSVNAQLFETVRKGIKDKARSGMGGEAAKTADKTISDLYSTKKLIDKNTEAVNKLQQKISERGVFEKAGYLVSKYADILTGGSIRGIVGGILPRGAGYKTMNALDLQSRLSKNLEIINRAQKAKTPAEMEKILGEIKN